MTVKTDWLADSARPERHRPYTEHGVIIEPSFCDWCAGAWPCATVRALAAERDPQPVADGQETIIPEAELRLLDGNR